MVLGLAASAITVDPAMTAGTLDGDREPLDRIFGTRYPVGRPGWAGAINELR